MAFLSGGEQLRSFLHLGRDPAGDFVQRGTYRSIRVPFSGQLNVADNDAQLSQAEFRLYFPAYSRARPRDIILDVGESQYYEAIYVQFWDVHHVELFVKRASADAGFL